MNRIKHIAAVLLLMSGVAQASEASKATQVSEASRTTHAAAYNMKKDSIEFLEDKKLSEIQSAFYGNPSSGRHGVCRIHKYAFGGLDCRPF